MDNDIKTLELLSKIDLIKFGNGWNIATEEEHELVMKDYKLRLRVIQICGIVIFLMLGIAIILVYTANESLNDLKEIIVPSMITVAFYLIMYYAYISRFNKLKKDTVYCLRGCVDYIRYNQSDAVIIFWYKDFDDALKLKTVFTNKNLTRNNRKISVGDCIRVVKHNNVYYNGGLDNEIGSMMKDENTEQGIIADLEDVEIDGIGEINIIEEKKIVIGDDHRIVKFFIKENISSTQFMAIVDRLDISDERPVLSFREYYVENYDLNGGKKPVYEEFVENILKKVGKKMTTQYNM